MLIINGPGAKPAIAYDHPDTVREHIAFLAQEDPETLADMANALLDDLETAREEDR